MATEDRFMNEKRGAGSRFHSMVPVTLTMAAGATATGTVTVPYGTILSSISAHVLTAFTGSPTNINFSVGTTAAGVDVVAAVDLKAQGRTTTTLVAGFDNCTGTTTTYYLTLAAVGGTNPAGTLYAFVNIVAPVPGTI